MFQDKRIYFKIPTIVKQLDVIHFDREIVQHATLICFTITKKTYGSYINMFRGRDVLNNFLLFKIWSLLLKCTESLLLQLERFSRVINMFCYDLNNPVNIPCGKKPEYPELTHDFQEDDSLYISDINLRGKKRFCQIIRYDFIEIVLSLFRQKIQK